MKPYQTKLQNHLADYAKNQLGLDEKGQFRGKSYGHILPDQLWYLNFLEPVRGELREYLKRKRHIKLHQYFHHLNSSQAFAFNFFYPFFAAGGDAAKTLSGLLGVDSAVKDWDFEVIPDKQEGTNVDVMWGLAKGGNVLCEVKLSEAEFGKAKSDDEHKNKRIETYLPRLKGYVTDDLLQEETFFGHYQLLRNIWLMAENKDDHLVLLMPRANESLSPQLETVLAGTKEDVRDRIHVAYIEDCLSALMDSQSLTPDLRSYARSLSEKYVPTKPGR